MIFGNLGERFGRRFVLVTTLVVMGTTTAMIGLLPTYESAGILAPILLVVLRFVQGAALGGEWAGAVLLCVEHGSDAQRGRNGAWTQVGPALGTLMATGLLAWITAVLSPAEFQAWGWRLPFLASVLLVIFGLWIRRGVAETPVYQELDRRQLKSQAPISEVVKLHWRGLLRVIGVRLGPDVWLLAGGGFFTELFGDGPRLAQATCVDFVVDRSRVQRALGGVLRCFVGQARTPCRVRRWSGLNYDVGVRVLCAARHASTAADYACHSRRIDCSRNDVRPSGRFHHRAISSPCAICGFFDGLHAGRTRRRWNRARNFRDSVT